MNTKHLSRALAFALAAAAAAPALAQISGSLDINKPGVYGRISLGPQPGVAIPPPTLIYPQPVIIAPAPVAVVQRPIYLYVPPGHAKDWAKHCSKYAACGQPVLFVQEGWVRDRYAFLFSLADPTFPDRGRTARQVASVIHVVSSDAMDCRSGRRGAGLVVARG